MKIEKTSKLPSLKQIRRSVASSTAIETGASIKTLEAILKTRRSKFQHLKLAK